MSYDDLERSEFMSDMITNSLRQERRYLQVVLPQHRELQSWNRSTFKHKLFRTVARNGEIVKLFLEKELSAADSRDYVETMINGVINEPNETWKVITLLTPTEEAEEADSKVIFLRYYKFEKEFEVHILKGRKPFSVRITKPVLIDSTSLFGGEVQGSSLVSPAGTSEDEMKTYYSINTAVILAALKEMAHLKGIDSRNPASEFLYKEYKWRSTGVFKKKGLGAIMAYIYAAAAIIKAVSYVWKAFASIFGTKVKTTLMGEYKAKGFREYSIHSTLRKYTGVQARYLPQIIPSIARIATNDHPTKQSEIAASLSLVEYIQENAWSMDDVTIDVANSSQDKFFTVMSNKDNNGEKYNFILLDFDVSFKLAPNLLIYKRTKSVFGGAFGSEKAIIEEVPRSINQEDIKALRAFHMVLAYKLILSDLDPSQDVNFPSFP